MIKSIFNKIIYLFLFVFILFSPQRAFADSTYYSNLSDEELSNIMNLNVVDIVDPWQWITDMQTYVVLEQDNETGYIQYWWNAPNIQTTATNELYKYITNSGYGVYYGKDPAKSTWLVPSGSITKGRTAQQKYGFNIPIQTYLGERPLITISIADVILPDNPVDAVTGVLDLVFTGNLIAPPSNQDLNSLSYIAPRDYDTNDKSWETWVRKNWYTKAVNIEDGQLLISGLDEEGKDSDGKQWTKYSIFNDAGVNSPDLTPKNICDRLKHTCGSKYQEVVKNILLVCNSNASGAHYTTRIMPYDLEQMNNIDRELFNNVIDPRAEIQKGLFGTGYDNYIKTFIPSFFLGVAGRLSELTVALTQIASFNYFDNTGIDPIILWTGEVIRILLLILFTFVLFQCVKAAYKVFIDYGTSGSFVIKAAGSFLLACLIVGLALNPGATYNLIKTVSTNAFNIANVGFQIDNSVSSLYGTGDAHEKEQCEYWLPYFNLWTVYNTNHTIMDQEQDINNTPNNKPEKKDLAKVKIGGVEQNLWSTILADSLTTSNGDDNSVYRMVDHFMAPRISNIEISEDNIDFDVSTNENYNGNIQTSIEIGPLLTIITILIIAIIKVFIFYEFIFNIMLLFVNLCISIDNLSKIVKVIKELAASMVNVMAINMIMGFLVMISITLTGAASIVINIFFFWILIQIYKMWMNTNSVFRPKSLCGIRQISHQMRNKIGI